MKQPLEVFVSPVSNVRTKRIQQCRQRRGQATASSQIGRLAGGGSCFRRSGATPPLNRIVAVGFSAAELSPSTTQPSHETGHEFTSGIG